MSGLARSSHRALNFQRNLTRTITLADGRHLKSLHDALHFALYKQDHGMREVA